MVPNDSGTKTGVAKPALTVGVFGSATDLPGAVEEAAFNIGRLLAYHNATVLTGACSGVSAAAVAGSKSVGGRTVGISPAANAFEHTEQYGLPTKDLDTIVYTGAGFKGRNVVAVRSSDVCIFIRGGVGTLNEFTIALDESKPVGILVGTGGTADLVPSILQTLISDGALRYTGEADTPTGKPSWGQVICEANIETLVSRIVAYAP